MLPLTNTCSNTWGIYSTAIFGNWNKRYRSWTSVMKKRDEIYIPKFLDFGADLIKFKQRTDKHVSYSQQLHMYPSNYSG